MAVAVHESPGVAASPPVPSARDHVTRWTWALFAIGAVVGAVIALAAAYDWRPVAGTSIVYVVGYPVAILAHFSLGALVVGGIMDLVETSVLPRRWQRAVMSVVVLVYLGLVVAADLFVMGQTSTTTQTVWYFVVVGVAAVLGGVAAFLVVSPEHLENSTGLGVNMLAGMGGAAVGAVVFVLVVVVASWIRHTALPDGEIAVPAVRGVTGEYVVLGESYSAGEGLDPFDPYTGSGGNGCHRSSKAYSQWLIFDDAASTSSGLVQPPPQQFVACSGAIISHVYDGRFRDGKMVVEPQVVKGADYSKVGLVTITMGGNDVLFSKIVLHCMEHDECMADPFGASAGLPSTGQEGAAEPANPDNITDQTFAPELVLPSRQALRDWARDAIALVDQRVDTLYGELHESFPNARIVVIGYPHLVPAREAPYLPTDCATVLRRFSKAERDELRDLTDQLNGVLYARAARHGLEFVSAADAFNGHEPCGDKGEYTNAVKLALTPNIVDGGSFHPNEQGQKALARLVACYLDSTTTAPDLLATPASSLPPAPGSIGHPVSCPSS